MLDTFNRVVISHFYNEAYLLPWWLEHHKKIFDFGIMIDYDSTDGSADIVRSICPDWAVVKSIHADFNAADLDQQVLGYEREMIGWRIALTSTEFLIGDVAGLTSNLDYPDSNNSQDPKMINHLIPVNQMFDWNPQGTLDKQIPFFKQVTTGIDYRVHPVRGCRSLHNHRFRSYTLGRHFHGHTTTDACILHTANCISSPEMLARRLQIQHRIPFGDKARNAGWQHHNNNHPNGLTAESLHDQLMVDWYRVTDCSEIIQSCLDKMHT